MFSCIPRSQQMSYDKPNCTAIMDTVLYSYWTKHDVQPILHIFCFGRAHHRFCWNTSHYEIRRDRQGHYWGVRLLHISIEFTVGERTDKYEWVRFLGRQKEEEYPEKEKVLCSAASVWEAQLWLEYMLLPPHSHAVPLLTHHSWNLEITRTHQLSRGSEQSLRAVWQYSAALHTHDLHIRAELQLHRSTVCVAAGFLSSGNLDVRMKKIVSVRKISIYTCWYCNECVRVLRPEVTVLHFHHCQNPEERLGAD